MKNYFLKPLFAVAALVSVNATAGTTTSCDKIAQDVGQAVAKQPAKVLMIVEDALVINETCACEIVRSAIAASSADQTLIKKIVETAVAVAPKMTAVIQECAGTGAEVASVDATRSGKSGKSGPDNSILPPKDGTRSDGSISDGGSDYNQGGRVDIRGVYLSLPAAGGFVTNPDTKNGGTSSSSSNKGTKTVVIIRERRIIVTPTSPTTPNPKL